MNLRRYYLAYGMNTNKDQMSRRCPNAKSLGKVVLKNHKLTFKQFCDVVPETGKNVECALWEITEQCEHALDSLEGYPHFYKKKEVDVWHNGRKIRAMIYYMTDYYKAQYPSEYYFRMVVDGYNDHNMSVYQIDDALEEVEHAYSIGA